MREEGDGLSRFLVETKFTDGALLLVDGRKRMDTMECTGIRTSSPMRVVQSCLKLGSGADQLSWQEHELRQTSNQKPASGECLG